VPRILIKASLAQLDDLVLQKSNLLFEGHLLLSQRRLVGADQSVLLGLEFVYYLGLLVEQGLHLELVSLHHLVLDGELLGVRALSVSARQLEIGSSSLLFLE
jgi:hypothetical protein